LANLILTKVCNKNCSFCFAKQFRKDEAIQEEMTLDTVSSILDKIKEDGSNTVSLLGGEPTEHSKFEEIIDMCVSRKFNISLISNFLFSEKIQKIILNNISSFSFLANAMELKNNGRIDTFAKNYNAIYNITSKKVGCGITFADDLLTEDGFDSYMNFLRDNLQGIDKVRISLNFPSDGERKDTFEFINNHNLGDLIYYAIRKILFIGATPNIDCISFPCLYKNDKIREFVSKYDDRNSKYICQGAPADYFPDGTVRYCFPTSEISLDGTKFRSSNGIQNSLKGKYTTIQKKLSTPKDCVECKFFKEKICQGLCLGLRRLDV
jgi:MoaA/NifB/PqqE/SkfB family radical SAM enzyme